MTSTSLSTRTISLIPRASTLIKSMRNIGYSLESALADIIDNSITAGARTIQIFAEIENSQIQIGILDDGNGMSEQELHEALRLGSRNPDDFRDRTDLGRFGLGLKTASISQCRRLSVVTRRQGRGNAAIWDLDHAEEADNWVIQIPNDYLEVPLADQLGESGTLVLWEKLDKLSRQAGVCDLEGLFATRMDETRKHLELVFHRFLASNSGPNKVKILLNGVPLVPFDPFNSSHPATCRDPKETIRINDHLVTLQAFTLPHHSKVSSSEWKRYEGKGGYLKSQGFYVYREKRLILYGTWFGLARQKELTKLSRVKVDIPNGLDSLWDIDVKKSSARPPQQVRAKMRNLIERMGGTSERVYRARGRRLTSGNRLPVWDRVKKGNTIFYRINEDHPVLENFSSRLPEELKAEFSKILELTGATLPVDALFADFGETPEEVRGTPISNNTLASVILTALKRLQQNGVTPDAILDMVTMSDPFKSNWELTKKILQELGIERSRS